MVSTFLMKPLFYACQNDYILCHKQHSNDKSIIMYVLSRSEGNKNCLEVRQQFALIISMGASITKIIVSNTVMILSHDRL